MKPERLPARRASASTKIPAPGSINGRERRCYFTHWGFGRYDVDADDRTVRLQNGYDPFSFVLLFDDELLGFRCIASNHSDRPVGDMVFHYGRQELPPPRQ